MIASGRGCGGEGETRFIREYFIINEFHIPMILYWTCLLFVDLRSRPMDTELQWLAPRHAKSIVPVIPSNQHGEEGMEEHGHGLIVILLA